MAISLQADSTLPQGYILIDGQRAATISTAGLSATVWGANAITTNSITDGAVTASKIANNAILNLLPSGSVLQTRYAEVVGVQTITNSSLVATSETNPTTTFGPAILSATLATSNANNSVLVQGAVLVDGTAAGNTCLFVFANEQLIHSSWKYAYEGPIAFNVRYTPPNTSSVLYRVFTGNSSTTTVYINRYYAYDYFNTGQQRSTLIVQEIKG